jgi:hypothetical protein
MLEFVLCVRACEDCPPLPVFRVLVPSDVLDFFARRPVGWKFDEWVREKLASRGISLPEGEESWWLEHPIFTLRRGLDRASLLALPVVVLP